MNDLADPAPDDRPGPRRPVVDPPTERSAPAVAPDVAAFSAFYLAETPGLVTFLLWLGARLPDAADLAQETMLDAYRGWSGIRHPRAWTRRVASRKYARRLAAVEEPLGRVDGTPLLPAHHDHADWEQHHEILRLLADLPARQRQVMAWTFDGYTPHEIAAELGVTPEAVRSSLRLARRALAARLGGEGDDAQ